MKLVQRFSCLMAEELGIDPFLTQFLQDLRWQDAHQVHTGMYEGQRHAHADVVASGLSISTRRNFLAVAAGSDDVSFGSLPLPERYLPSNNNLAVNQMRRNPKLSCAARRAVRKFVAPEIATRYHSADFDSRTM